MGSSPELPLVRDALDFAHQFLTTGDPGAMDQHLHTLARLGRLDRIEAVAHSRTPMGDAFHSRLAVTNAYAMSDACEFLRRAERHIARHAAEDGGVLAKVEAFCGAYQIAAADVIRITGGQALCEAIPLPPERTGRGAGASDWLSEAPRLLARNKPLAAFAMFLANYDWLNTDPDVYDATKALFRPKRHPFLLNHIQMAPYQNGGRTLRILEAYVAALFRAGRLAEITQVLEYEAVSPKLEMYRILAGADNDGDPEGRSPPVDDRRPEDAGYAALLDLRQRARTVRGFGSNLAAKTRGMPRIALCVSGQLRAYQPAMWQLLAALRGQGEVDVFVSTWERIGGVPRRYLTSAFSPEVAAFFDARSDRLEAVLKATLPGVESGAVVSHEELSSFFGTPHVRVENEEDFDRRLDRELPGPARTHRNQLKMLYKIHDAWRMLDDHARREQLSYDLVVRVRPDLRINNLGFEEIFRRTAQDDVVAVTSIFDEAMDDRIGFGGPGAMAVYASMWPALLEAGTHRYLPTVQESLGERLLLAHLFASGCRVVLLRESGAQRLMPPHYDDQSLLDRLETCAEAGPLSEDQGALLELLRLKQGVPHATARRPD